MFRLFKKFKRNSAINRQDEEKLYEFISQEMKAGIIREGLMTKAKVNTNGNKDQIEAEYIKLRMQSILDEYVLEDFLREIENENFKNEQEIKEKLNIKKNKDNEDDSSYDLKLALYAVLITLIAGLFAYLFSDS